MPDRLFLLMEHLQRLDERLHLTRARPKPDALEVLRLSLLRHALRHRLSLIVNRGRLPGGMLVAAQAG